jgi:glycosyltransferase involved in cell wall biosynthesis
MTKLLVTCGNYASGGAERVLSVLSKGFADSFSEVVYLSWLDTPDFYQFDKRITRVSVEHECKSHSLLKMGLWFRRYVKREGFNVILSFLEPWNVLVCGSLKGIKVPIVVADRNDPRAVWNKGLQLLLRRWAYSKAKGIVCQTENNRGYYTGKYLEKAHVIYNPVFLPQELIGKALTEEKRNRIVAAARLAPQKNLGMMLKAFASFQQNHPDYTLTIYGEGPSRGEIEKQFKDMGLENCVELPGAVKNLWDLIMDARCFALSSWNEGMPNALIEALCLGIPCVATKVSGAVDLIKSGDNGLLVDLDDDKAMAECFEKLANDSELADSLGVNATKIYELLRQDVIGKQWVDYLKTFIK